MNKGKILLLLLSLPIYVFPQNNNKVPCSSPEFNQFDFWLGKWDLFYSDSMHATNQITKDLDGCVIFENFNDPKQQFKGKSWSVYNPAKQRWEQTWVDNQGAYITLTGAFENDKMTLSTAPGISQKRMIFYNVKESALDWVWESTTDSGRTWKQLWKIHYTRLSK